MQPNSKRNQRGFTLVELMVAVTIIGILAAVGIPRLFAYVRTSSTAEVSQNAGKIIAGLESYAQAQLKTPAQIVAEVDGTTVTPDGDGTLTAFLPTIEVPTGSNFEYEIAAAVAADGPAAGDVAYCITATGQDGATVPNGQVLYTNGETDVAGWDRRMNRVAYVNGVENALTGVEAGGYCTAAGAVSTDYVDAAAAAAAAGGGGGGT